MRNKKLTRTRFFLRKFCVQEGDKIAALSSLQLLSRGAVQQPSARLLSLSSLAILSSLSEKSMRMDVFFNNFCCIKYDTMISIRHDTVWFHVEKDKVDPGRVGLVEEAPSFINPFRACRQILSLRRHHKKIARET